MLNKTTTVYAHHGIDVECDIYQAAGYAVDAPVFLFFHSGGLTNGHRAYIPPWLVQACYQRKWPLISASYRFLPQMGSKGLVEDACAAFDFARKWGVEEGQVRRVIGGGASAGFFLACQLARRGRDLLALFSIAGIATFRHEFFNMSTISRQLIPDLLSDEDLEIIKAGPVVGDNSIPGDERAFVLDKLLLDGSRNPEYLPPKTVNTWQEKSVEYLRGNLYETYTAKNAWNSLVGDIDDGYRWGTVDAVRRGHWPPTVILHGDADTGAPIGVSESMHDGLGSEKVFISVAAGQEHLYERCRFVEDQGPEMDAVRKALHRLDEVLASL